MKINRIMIFCMSIMIFFCFNSIAFAENIEPNNSVVNVTTEGGITKTETNSYIIESGLPENYNANRATNVLWNDSYNTPVYIKTFSPYLSMGSAAYLDKELKVEITNTGNETIKCTMYKGDVNWGVSENLAELAIYPGQTLEYTFSGNQFLAEPTGSLIYYKCSVHCSSYNTDYDAPNIEFQAYATFTYN